LKKIILQAAFLCSVGFLFAQDSTLVLRKVANSTVTILSDSGVCGSGFFIDDSIIATNYHVIKDAKNIFYRINNSPVKYDVRGFVAVDKTFDLILLKVTGINKPPAAVAASEPVVGEKVYAICAANGQPSIISGGKVILKLGLNGDTLLQISTSLSYKANGGPVLNSLGELIGVFVIDYENGQALDIAIPIKYLENLINIKSSIPAPFSELNALAKTPVLAAKAYFQEGLQRFIFEDYKTALQNFNNAINLYPNDTDAYEFLGITRILLDDYLGAITDFNRFLKLNPGSKDAYYHRGISRRRIDDYTEAIPDFDSAIDHDPNYAEAYLNRGLAEVQTQDFEDAEDDLTRTIDLNLNYSNSYISNALIQEKVQHYRAAIQDLTICLSQNPNEFIAYLLRGYAKYRSENLNAAGTGPALDDYRIGIERSNTHEVNIDYYDGLAKYKMGDYKFALQYFIKAIVGDPRYTDAYFYLGLVNSALMNNQSAMQYYNKAIEMNPIYSKAYCNRGILKSETNDYQGALTDLNQAIKLDPNNGGYYYNRALVKLKSGDKEGGCSDLNKAKEFGNGDTGKLINENCR
jgi:tetratricopeptide (TPR) repeat protein